MKDFTNDEIKELFKNAANSSARAKIFRNNKDLADFCNRKVAESNSVFKTLSEYVRFIVDGIKLKICPICGKQMSFKQSVSNIRTCSVHCSRFDEPFINRKPFDREARREKFKKTCIERFGAESPLSKGTLTRNKADEHWKSLGVENPGQLEEVKAKIRKTNMERYGNEKYLKSDDFNRRRKETCLNHFGVDHQFKSKAIQEKCRQTLQERYGVNNAYLMKESKDAQRATKNHQSFLNLSRFKDFVIPLFDESEWEGTRTNKIYKWKCVKCGNEFEQRMYSTNFMKDVSEEMPRCLECFPKINGFSYGELELLEFCKSMFPSAHKDKSIIKPLELDVVIDELKIALEFNGLFYHCIQCKPAGYHLMKTKLCNEKGYRLLHVWEDDWMNRKKETKDRIRKALLGEDLTFNELELSLPNEWYNSVEVPGYELMSSDPPTVANRAGFEVEDCGALHFRKTN